MKFKQFKELLENKYRVSIKYNNKLCKPNCALITGNEIFYGKFNNEKCKIFAILHEIGHLITRDMLDNSDRYFKQLGFEGMAWEIAFDLCFKYKIKVTKKMEKFATWSFFTYLEGDMTRLDLKLINKKIKLENCK